jgi:ferrochelatase
MSRYLGEEGFRHGGEECIGILLMNLGTPEAPTRRALRAYLREFLSDPRVVELPRWLWALILHGVILNVRPRLSARAYAKVWTDQGSPLLQISRRQAAALATALEARFPGPVRVALGMRYGAPSVPEALLQLHAAGARRLLVLPLYPQYSGSTAGSVFDAVADVLKRWRWVPAVRFVSAYHDHPRYIEALATSIRRHWERHGRGQRLLMSFHGVPRRYLLAGDPYHCHCHKTGRLLAQELGLADEEWMVVFQSRFGREEWLRPYCDETLRALPAQGVSEVDVVCPGFSADCLETLEEIDQQNREFFLEAGGNRFHYIPCLNDSADHIELMVDLAVANAGGWPQLEGWNHEQRLVEAEQTVTRARAMGAER